MTDAEKKTLEQILWGIVSDHLRGTMGADRFKDYILGFIFYKYLSDRMHAFANNTLKTDHIDYLDIKPDSIQGMDYLEALREQARNDLGYFLRPDQLFKVIAERGRRGEFILDEVKRTLSAIEQSTMGGGCAGRLHPPVQRSRPDLAGPRPNRGCEKRSRKQHHRAPRWDRLPGG